VDRRVRRLDEVEERGSRRVHDQPRRAFETCSARIAGKFLATPGGWLPDSTTSVSDPVAWSSVSRRGDVALAPVRARQDEAVLVVRAANR
jgi:hypothetical protein